MNIFNALGTVINSTTGFITSTARTMEKTVLLVEKEVDNMHEGDVITVKQIKINDD
jgi:hypothetical protein